MNIKDAILTVFKRYHFNDSNFLKILEKFYPKNLNELNENGVYNDDELCFVDYLKQQSYDDKISFDNDQIFNHVNLYLIFTKLFDS